MRGITLKIAIGVFAALFCFVNVSAEAQGWRLFSKKIKEEAQTSKKSIDARDGGRTNRKSKEEKKVDDAKTSEFSADSSDSKSEPSQNDRQPLDLTRVASDNESESSEESAPVQRDRESDVSSGGLLDFSNALEDDAARYLGDAENEPTSQETNFAPSLPSYRNLPEQKNDARLNDVCFISATTGWVVGDRGTILKTTDGGQTWALSDVPTDANLFAVSFLDENYGLAVGGSIVPSTKVGLGVLLRTVDGGTTWDQIELSSFPILRDVRILDESQAWIAGDSSNLYPSGLFTSSDTGIEWSPVEGERRGGWRSAMFDPAARLGLGVTTEGRAQSVDGATAQYRATSLGKRRATDLAFDPTVNAVWLVGDSGLVLRSNDFGANWAQTPGGFPNRTQNYFDLETVVARDGFVGAVGTPGTLFFYSEDGGNIWRAAPTGIKTPLRKLAFADRQNGWAVGDLGTIVATNDGGQTWRVQRSGGSRAAILGAYGRAEDVPFEAFAQFAGEEGFLTEVALVAQEIDKKGLSDETTELERLNEALVEVGASGVSQTSLFTLEPKIQQDSLDKIIARFNSENDGDGIERFRELLVRLIRTWRPSVVLTTDPTLENDWSAERSIGTINLSSSQGARDLVATLANDSNAASAAPIDPFQELLARELANAARSAGDPTVYPEHISACGLEPWTPLKARTARQDKTQGNATVDVSYFCSNLGRPVGEIAARARALLGTNTEVRQTTSFQTTFNVATLTCGDKTFFDGIELQPGGEARRARSTLLSQYVDAASARAGERRQRLAIADSLLNKCENDKNAADLLLAKLRGDASGLDSEAAVEYLSRVGRGFARQGALRDAEEAYSIVATELPDLPQSREALKWLVQYYSGSEPSRRTQTQGDSAMTFVSNNNAAPQGQTLQETNERLKNAEQLGNVIREISPETFMCPEARFPLAAAQIARGDLEGALKFYWNRSLASSDEIWGVRAAAEYWLRAPQTDRRAKENEFAPLSTLVCKRAPKRPKLDGDLEENVWSAASFVRLSTPYQEPPITRELTPAEQEAKEWRKNNRTLSTDMGTSVGLLMDDEYLYLAAHCPKLEKDVEVKDDPNVPRPRDANLSSRDRIEVKLDLDGDYITSFDFQFDSKGWTRDECWNETKWNPELFVAAKDATSEWTLEVAIPLTALTSATPRQGDVWRCAIRRVNPGRGVECWNVENSERGENAFGFLNFEVGSL